MSIQQSSWECHSEKCYCVYTVYQKQLGRRLCKRRLFATFVIHHVHNCVMRFDSVSRLHYFDRMVPTAAPPINHQNEQENTNLKIPFTVETPSLEKNMIFVLILKIPICIYIYLSFSPYFACMVLCMKTGQM